MGPTRPRHPQHKRRRCRAFFSHQAAIRAALTFCPRRPAYCLWVWLKKKKKKEEEEAWQKMQLLKSEETECRPRRDNHRLMWHSSIPTATREKSHSSKESSIKKGKENTAVFYAITDSTSSVKCFPGVLSRCRSVMACCAQTDFYEASQLHLSHFASIKPTEATVSRATSGC